MTAPLPPNADELVSAYLDGEAAPDEVTFVENSPELMARVEAMRSVAGALAAPVVPPAGPVRDVHLAAALGAFDELLAAGEFDEQQTLSVVAPDTPPTVEPTPPTAPSVTSLAAAHERRRPRRLNVIAAAAAAVALLFAGIVAIGLNAGDSRDVVDAPSEAVAVDSAAGASDTGDATESFTAEADEAVPEAPALAPEGAEIGEGVADVATDEEAAAAVAPQPTPPAPPTADGDAAADSAPADEPQGEDDAEEDFAVGAEAETDAIEEAPAGAGVTIRATSDLGAFVDLEDLGVELEEWLRASTKIDELETVDPAEVRSACAAEVRELGIESPSLLAIATVDGQLVEVHAVDASTVVVIDAQQCRPLLDVNV